MAIWLWLAKMDRPLSENEYHDMLELLPEDRRLRLERIPREKHQEVLCAYLLLRLALHDRYSWRTLPVISTEASGKPYFPAYPEVHFSLSHTAGAAAVAVADTPVGVDIEHIRPVSVRTMERIAGCGHRRLFLDAGCGGRPGKAHRRWNRDDDENGNTAESRGVLL